MSPRTSSPNCAATRRPIPELHLTSAAKGRGIAALRATLAGFALPAAPVAGGDARRNPVSSRPMSSPIPPRRPPPSADPVVKAAILAEALPYMRRYAGRTIVVKYGGHAMGNRAAIRLPATSCC